MKWRSIIVSYNHFNSGLSDTITKALMNTYDRVWDECRWDMALTPNGWLIIIILDKEKKEKCVNKFVLTTLYATIDHKLLIHTIKELIKNCKQQVKKLVNCRQTSCIQKQHE